MDIPEIAERISLKFVQKGCNVDRQKIEPKLRRLIEEFGVPPAEAERTVQNELFREFGIVIGPGGGGGGSEKKAIAEAVPGEWVTVEGRVVALSRPPSPAISATGVLSDESGSIRFVIWSKASAPEIRTGTWYRFESAVVDEFKGVSNLKVHSGTKVTEITHEGALIPNVRKISELSPGVGNVRAKVIQEWEANHERMLQTGLLGDETATIKFVMWKEEGKERLVPGTVYTIYYAMVDEYNGRLSLNLNTATAIPEEGDLAVSSGESHMEGALVHIAPGSGLIKRCPVEGCNRVLSRQNYCPVHEIQPKYIYDLRIKGWIDDGIKTNEVLVQREMVETLTGITLDQAQEIAENNPLGMDEVFLRIRDRVLGRYLDCGGREIDRRILANTCAFCTFNPGKHADLLNRAGGEQ
ncbi:MAG: nucleotide-binding protein [Methanoregulaceae archaeon]|nr:nucleotide-binding protein [Methanoregulaceae archaeon]